MKLSNLCFVLSFVLALAFADNFDRYDSNGDGVLSRPEFGSFIAAAKGSVDPFLGSVEKVVGGDSGSALVLEGEGLMTSTINGLLVILVTELGDKTFFIAAILAMRHVSYNMRCLAAFSL